MRAREAGADIASLEGEAVQKVLTHNEQDFQDDLGHKMVDVTAKETTTDTDLASALGVLGNFVGLPEEQIGLVVQLGLLLHPLLHLVLEEKTELDIYNLKDLQIEKLKEANWREAICEKHMVELELKFMIFS